MVEEIIKKAISEIQSEKIISVQKEMDRVQSEIILPKYIEFDNEKQACLNAENDRHTKTIESIEQTYSAKKLAYEKEVKGTVENSLEQKYHYEAKIKSLNELL